MATFLEHYGADTLASVRAYMQDRHDSMSRALHLAEMTNNTLYSSQEGREEVRGMRGRISALRHEIGIIDAALVENAA